MFDKIFSAYAAEAAEVAPDAEVVVFRNRDARAAEATDQIPEPVKKERLKRLNDLQARKTAENNQKYLGHRGEVLIEGFDRRQQTILFGKLDTFKMVYFPGDEKLLGTYQTVTVTECARNSLLGRME